MNRYIKGKKGEDIACKYLEEKGYLVIERNYRTKDGEIDIIARDGDIIVFTEVKCWQTIPVSEAEFSINMIKKKRMINSAMQYVFENKNFSSFDIRFDFIFINMLKNSVIHSKNIITES